MIDVVASCTLGTTPCNDVGTGTSSLVPGWGVVLIIVGAIALIAGFVGLLIRANHRQPWS